MSSRELHVAALKVNVEGAAEFQKSLGEINRDLKQSQAELAKVTAAYAKNDKSLEVLNAKKIHLNNAINSNTEVQRELNRQLAEATEKYGENSQQVQVLATKLTRAEAEGIGLTRQLGELNRELEEQERAIRGLPWTELGRQMEEAGQRMQSFGSGMTAIGNKLSMAVTAPLLGIGVAAVAVGSDFADSMGTIQARTNMTADEVDGLGSAFRALALSGNYGTFTAREVSSAFAGIAVAGQDSQHGIDIMRHAMVLAGAVGDDLGNTAYFLGNYLAKIGKDASYAEKYINLFATANQRTGIGLSTLQDYLFRANASLNAASISGTEATAVFSQLYAAGVRGANAYSGFSQAITSLLLPTAAQVDAFNELGISLDDYYWQQKSTMEQFFALGDALANVTDDTRRLDLQTTIFTQGSAQAFADELFNQRDSLRMVIPELYAMSSAVDGTGIAFQMAAIQNDGLSSSMQQVRISLEEISLQIATHLIPHVQRGIETIGRLVNWFGSFEESTQRNIIRVAGFVAAIGPVLSVGGKLISIVGSITSAFGASATAIGQAGIAMNSAGTFKAIATAKLPIMTKALGITTLAFKKLWLAMGPVGIAVAGIYALTAGIVLLSRRNNELSESTRELVEETQRIIDVQHELAEASASAIAQFQAQRQEMQIQSRYINGLVDSIERLANQQELSAGEMQTLQNHIEGLNSSVPNLSLAYDSVTDSLNMTIDALRDYISMSQLQSSIDMKLAEQNRLRDERLRLDEELNNALRQRMAYQNRLFDIDRGTTLERAQWQHQVERLIVVEQNYGEALQANKLLYSSLIVGVEYYSQSLDDLRQAQQQAETAIEEVTSAMEAQIHVVESLGVTQEEIWNKISSSLESYSRIATNAFSTISENAATSVQDLTSNLQSNARAVEEWSINIAKLAERGVDEGLIQQLRDAGPAAAATVRELVQASDEELDALNYAFEESTRIAVEAMKRELDPSGVAESIYELIDVVANTILENDSMETALRNQITAAFDSLSDTIKTIGFDEAGYSVIDGFTGAIDSMLPEVERAGDNMGDSLLDGLNDTLEIQSPSRVTRRIGVNAGEGLIEGVQEVTPRVENSAKTLAYVFINAIADKIRSSHDIDRSIVQKVNEMREIGLHAVTNANFFDIGKEMASGVSNGLRSSTGIVSREATAIINNALASMREAAKISSPSKESMRVAHQLGDGLIIGITAKGKEFAEACKTITNYAINSFNIDPSKVTSSFKGVSQVLSNEVTLFAETIGQSVPDGMAIGIDQQGHIAVMAAEKLSSDVYQRAAVWIREYQKTFKHSTEEELKMWQHLIKNHEISGNERLKVEENISRLQDQIRQASFDYYRTLIERQSELNQLSAQEEIEAWQRVVDKHEEGTEQRIAAEQNLARVREQVNRDKAAALKEMERLEAGYLRAVENRTQALVNTFDKFREVNIAETNVDRARDAMEKATEVYARAREELIQSRQAMSEAERGTEEFTRAQERVGKANEAVARAHDELTRATENASRSQATIMADNLQRQLDNIRDWEKEMSELSQRGVYEGLIEHFRQMGPTSTQYLRELNNSTDEELGRLSDLYQEKHAEARRLAINELEGLRHETDQAIGKILTETARTMVSEANPIGMELVRGIIQGFEDKSGALYGTVNRIMNDVIEEMRRTAQIQSPSRRTRDLARLTMDGLIVGMESKESELIKACKQITDIMADNLYIDPSELVNTSNAVLSSMKHNLPKLQKQMVQYSSQSPVYSHAPNRQGYSSNGYGQGDVYNITLNVDIDKISDVHKLMDIIGNTKHHAIAQRGVP